MATPHEGARVSLTHIPRAVTRPCSEGPLPTMASCDVGDKTQMAPCPSGLCTGEQAGLSVKGQVTHVSGYAITWPSSSPPSLSSPLSSFLSPSLFPSTSNPFNMSSLFLACSPMGAHQGLSFADSCLMCAGHDFSLQLICSHHLSCSLCSGLHGVPAVLEQHPDQILLRALVLLSL